MADALSCAGCGGEMEEGFVIDHGHYSFPAEQQWVEGEPKRSFWTGLETAGRRQYNVVTYRCGRCGRLESYARDGAT